MLGIMSDEDFQLELLRNTSGEVKSRNLGRGADKNNTPQLVRELVAEVALDGASNQAVAEAFDVSPSSVSAYKNGATSCATYNEPQSALKSVVNNKKHQIAEMAHTNIINALRAITPDKVSESGIKTASQLPPDMSVVKKNIKDDFSQNKHPVFVIFAPQNKSEDDNNKPIQVIE